MPAKYPAYRIVADIGGVEAIDHYPDFSTARTAFNQAVVNGAFSVTLYRLFPDGSVRKRVSHLEPPQRDTVGAFMTDLGAALSRIERRRK